MSSKITGLLAETAILGVDLLTIVTQVSTAPTNNKITFDSFMTNIGNYGINSLNFSLTPSVIPNIGELYWDAGEETIAFGVEGGSIAIGKEGFEYYTNLSGVTLVDGDVVSIVDVSGNRAVVHLTDATNSINANNCVGMVTHGAIVNEKVRVTRMGAVHNLNTNAFIVGLPVYVDPANPGKLTQVKPAGSNYIVNVGIVLAQHLTVGIIDIYIKTYPKFQDLSGVNGTALTTTGQFGVWDQTSQYFDFNYNILNYANKLGLAGGQTIIGGTFTGEGLTLQPNATNTTTGSVLINATTASTSTTTGALRVVGGLGVEGALFGTTGAFSGVITSTVATDTAPFTVASTTLVNNLNSERLNGVQLQASAIASTGVMQVGAFGLGAVNLIPLSEADFSTITYSGFRKSTSASNPFGAYGVGVYISSGASGTLQPRGAELFFTSFGLPTGKLWFRTQYDGSSYVREIYHSNNSNLSTVDWNVKKLIAAETIQATTGLFTDVIVGNKTGGSQSNSIILNRLANTDSLNFIFNETDVTKASIGIRPNTDGLSIAIGSLILANTKIYVDTTGNVGFGTVTPLANGIEVARLGSSDGATYPEIRISNTFNGAWTTNAIQGRLGFYSSDASGIGPAVRCAIDMYETGTTGSDNGLGFATAVSGLFSYKMFLTNTGRLGLGLQSPQRAIHIYNSVPVIRLENSANGIYSEIAADTTTGVLNIIADALNLGTTPLVRLTAYNVVALDAGTTGTRVYNKLGVNQTVGTEVLEVNGNMKGLGSLILPKTAGIGIKIDTTTPTFGWQDLTGFQYPDTTAPNSPTIGTFIGGSVRRFSYSAGDKMDGEFHMPHDYAPGTDIYIHVHWSHNGTAISGNAVMTFAFTYAKGHTQEIFPIEKTATINYNTVNIATTPRYIHRIDEFQISNGGGDATHIDRALLEPDGVIGMNFTFTTIPTITGGSPNEPFVFFIDLHYQSTGLATKNKVPNFYA